MATVRDLALPVAYPEGTRERQMLVLTLVLE